MLAQLDKFFPKKYGSYFEPFLGGGAVFFYLKPKKAYINDINETLVFTYKALKDDPQEIISLLERLKREYLKKSEEERKSFYLKIRRDFNSLKNLDHKKAAYLIFLNKTGYNGMYRENSSGELNVPFGKYKNPNILDLENLISVSKVLKGATISSLSFEDAVSKAKKGDFVYFDPPYYPLSKTANFTGYAENGFLEEQQVKLRDTFKALDKKGCFVMLSNSYTPFIKELYKGYRLETVNANRAINCKANGRGKIKEYVILNY